MSSGISEVRRTQPTLLGLDNDSIDVYCAIYKRTVREQSASDTTLTPDGLGLRSSRNTSGLACAIKFPGFGGEETGEMRFPNEGHFVAPGRALHQATETRGASG